jgi:hypothetical protein
MFAGAITGNAVTHILVAILLNVILPIVYLLSTGYTNNFLYGHSPADTGLIASFLHPFSYFMTSMGQFASNIMRLNQFDTFLFLLYIAAAAVICTAAGFLYRAAKAERAGEPMTFPIAAYIVAFLVTFVGMSGGAFLFYGMLEPAQSRGVAFYPTPAVFYIGALIGAGVSLILITMLLRGTPKVFNLRTLRDFGCYAACAAVFLALTTTNLTGFETKVPNTNELKGASADVSYVGAIPYKWNPPLTVYPISDADSLEALTALHRDMLDKAERYGRFETEPNIVQDGWGESKQSEYDIPGYYYGNMSNVAIHYDNGGRLGINRRYDFRTSYFIKEDTFGRFMESRAYKTALTVDKIAGYDNLMSLWLVYRDSTPESEEFEASMRKYPADAKVIEETDVDSPSATPSDVSKTIISEKGALVEFVKCLDADFAALDADDMRGDNRVRMTFLIEYRLTAIASEKNGGAQTRANWVAESTYFSRDGSLTRSYLRYSITDKYERSVAWLKEHGLYDAMLEATAAMEKEMTKDDSEFVQ